MQFLAARHAAIGYLSGLTVILGLMLIVVSGLTAVNGKRADTVSKISMLEAR